MYYGSINTIVKQANKLFLNGRCEIRLAYKLNFQKYLSALAPTFIFVGVPISLIKRYCESLLHISWPVCANAPKLW